MTYDLGYIEIKAIFSSLLLEKEVKETVKFHTRQS